MADVVEQFAIGLADGQVIREGTSVGPEVWPKPVRGGG
ncbi:hypothetical protein MRBBS_1204 [Marinobacter sp. BSs20148]|nr:hypothetical protein MRBBS_1204 [Marinobacter sp. BSs20148]